MSKGIPKVRTWRVRYWTRINGSMVIRADYIVDAPTVGFARWAAMDAHWVQRRSWQPDRITTSIVRQPREQAS